MASLTAKASGAEKEQNEQVWKAFTQLLEQVETIFGEETLSVDDFLSICVRERWPVITVRFQLLSMWLNVKKYDLIQPHSAL